MAVTLFTGKPGSGKSYRVVEKLFKDCEKYYVFHNIDGLNDSFFSDGAFIRRWDSINDFLTLEKQKEICTYIQKEFKRSVLVIIDEAQSNGFKYSSPALLDWISYHRHLGQEIYLISQSRNSIHRDYVDRCQYEVRAKRGIATNQMIYQYSVEGEVFKTDRVPIKKAVFAAYKSFEIQETRKKTAPYLLYIAACLVACLSLGVYQVVWGVPSMFGKGKKEPAPTVTTATKPVLPVTPQIHKVVRPGAKYGVDKYRLSSCMGDKVTVQELQGGRLVALDDVIEEGYAVLECGRSRAIVAVRGGEKPVLVIGSRFVSLEQGSDTGKQTYANNKRPPGGGAGRPALPAGAPAQALSHRE